MLRLVQLTVNGVAAGLQSTGLARGPRGPRRPAPRGRRDRAGRGRTSAPGRARSRWPSRTCSGRAGGSWPSIATRGALRANEDGGRGALPGRRTSTTLVADLTGPLDLPELDGLVAANSLHYVARDRQVEVIRRPRRAPAAGRPVRRRRVRRRPRQPVGPAPVQRRVVGAPGGRGRARRARSRSAASRAGSSARSTRRSAAAPEGCLTTGVA